MSTPLRVGAYARVSSMNQVLDHDSSIDTQIMLIRQRAAYENSRASGDSKHRPWRIVDEYREEGRSGKDTDRPELQRLLADVRARKLDAIAVTKIDRITRSLVDFYDLWRAFEENKVEFIALNDSFDTTSATGRAMLKLTLVFAELERERTSERTREKVLARREAGKWFGGFVPLGYKVNPANPTTLELDVEVAERIRVDFFEKYLELGSARALTRYLSRRGIKRPRRTTQRGRAAGGSAFTTEGVLQILSNPVYIAKRPVAQGKEGKRKRYVYGDPLIDCVWPALIDEGLFQRVQAKLTGNSIDRPTGKPSAGHSFILEGRLRCGACGSMMVRASGKGRTGLYFYYKCGRKHRTAGETCRVRDIPADAVEKFVLDQLHEYAIDETAVLTAVREANAGRDDALARIEEELRQAQAALAQKSKEVGTLLDLVEASGNIASVTTRLRERSAEVETLRIEIADLQTHRDVARSQTLDAAVVAEGYRSLPRILDEAQKRDAADDLKEVLRSIVNVVEWYQSPKNAKEGWAEIQLYEMPGGLLRRGQKVEQQGEPALTGSSCCPDWLPIWTSVRTERNPLLPEVSG